MGLFKYFCITSIAAIAIYFHVTTDVLDPTIYSKEDKWYGTGSKREDDEIIQPFKVSVPQNVLEDLKQRLISSRISHDQLEDANDFTYGFNSKYLVSLKDYWITGYDWRKYEKILNSFNQFKTEVEGLQIHFIHEKTTNESARNYKAIVPILMVHGWPGNVFEFYKVIPLLIDPKKHGLSSDIAFEVVIPSIPGYGWSDSPKKRGFSQVECARLFHKLMKRLKIDKYYLQGGDWGSVVTSSIARIYPESIYALHLNMVSVFPGTTFLSTAYDILATFFPRLMLTSSKLQHNTFTKLGEIMSEAGYMYIQATKPDTVGTALNDSPIGLAAYILEKFSTWTNKENINLPDGGLAKKFSKDELLTMIMIYWSNGNIVNSQRFYKECIQDDRIPKLSKVYLKVPTGHSSGLNELFDRTPVELSRMFMNVTFYNEIPDMGHFACFEKPMEMAKDILAFVNIIHSHL